MIPELPAAAVAVDDKQPSAAAGTWLPEPGLPGIPAELPPSLAAIATEADTVPCILQV